jgi:hypothetical protein
MEWEVLTERGTMSSEKGGTDRTLERYVIL